MMLPNTNIGWRGGKGEGASVIVVLSLVDAKA